MFPDLHAHGAIGASTSLVHDGIGEQTMQDDEQITFTATASDDDSAQLLYRWKVDGYK